MVIPNRFSVCIISLVTVLLVDLFSPRVASPSQLTPQQKRGKQIYLRGLSTSEREITAMIGGGSVDVPAAVVPCANCHGLDGRGKPEGGITPSNITWEALTKPYGITHESGRKHPPHTDRSVQRAITEGIDPAGNQLAVAMPRYRMAPEDLADLVTYLERLGGEQDPGLTETSIRVGTILPAKGPLAQMGQAMRAVMTAYFQEVNDEGGIYNRRIELQVAESAGGATATREDVNRFIAGEPVFALVGVFIAGAEKEIASLVEKEEVPLVGPLTLLPQVGSPVNRFLFYLFSGLKNQARALVDFAVKRLGGQNPPIAIIYPEDEMLRGVTEAIEAQSKKHGWPSVTQIVYAHGQFNAAHLAREGSQGEAEVLFFLGSGSKIRALLKEADKLGWTPTVFLLGSLVGQEILDTPLPFANKIFLSYPTLPSDHTRAGIKKYRTLAAKHRLPPRHLAIQVLAYCAAKILVEGLKRAGKNLSREKLITALEGLYEFETGLTPPITYGPNRRIGALGAYVVAVNVGQKTLVPVSRWLTPQ